MDLGKAIKEAIDVYSKNFQTLFVAGLIATVLFCLTLGILAGPLMGGFLMLVLKVMRNEKGEFNEIYNYFDKFVPLFVTTLICFVLMMIIGIIPFLNPILGYLVNPVIAFIWAMAVIKIIEKNLAPAEALKEAVEMVKDYLFPVWLYSLVMSIIGCVGFIVFIIGGLVTVPITCVGMAVAYKELTTPVSVSGNWGFDG